MTTRTPLSEAVATVQANLLSGKLEPKTRGLHSLSDELQSLRKAGLSTHTIAREITAAGCPVSQTAVWRCLRKSKPKAKAKAKRASPSATPSTPPSQAPVASTTDDAAEATVLLAALQELQEPIFQRRQVQFPAVQSS